MRHDHTRDGEEADSRVDRPLVLLIEMASRFIEQQDARGTIERARQHNALHLPARKRTAHIAHQCLVAHRHVQDLIVYGRELCYLADAVRIGGRAKAGDVLGN